MNINRNNYEEYFLLYADKELSEEQKSMVEMFVQQNPDLEEEFVILQQSVVKPDNNILLENKSSLFRKEGFIDQTNYEEKFLLYTDGELNSLEIEETEKFVLANPALQHEFNVLQQVTYEPDTSIVFPEKQLLYKKDDDDNKVIPFPWRYLAAAILLGIGLWTGISYLQKNNTKPYIAVTPAPSKENTQVKINEQNKDETKPLVKIDNGITPKNKNAGDNLNITQKQPLQNVVAKNIQPANTKDEPYKPIDKKEEVIAVTNQQNKSEVPKLTNGLPQPINTTTEVNSKTTVASSSVLQTNNYAQPASYIEEAEVKSENYVFYNITTEEFRKSKVGNFLRKVKRAIESKIPLKNNSLKIGTVEIAKDDQN